MSTDERERAEFETWAKTLEEGHFRAWPSHREIAWEAWQARALAATPTPAQAPAFSKGDRVITPDDGEGTVTHVDAAKPARYHVHLGKGFGDVYFAEQLQSAAAPPQAAQNPGPKNEE